MSTAIRIELANERDRHSALALEEAVYAADHGHVPPREDGATYFVAKESDGAIVASFRILAPSFRPFDVEQEADLSFLDASRRVALIGRLCVRPDFRGAGRQAALPVLMLRTAYAHCRDEGFTDLLMYTFPHLCQFYERALFERRDARFFHAGYQTEMEILHLDLTALAARLTAGDRRAAMLYNRDVA